MLSAGIYFNNNEPLEMFYYKSKHKGRLKILPCIRLYQHQRASWKKNDQRNSYSRQNATDSGKTF